MLPKPIRDFQESTKKHPEQFSKKIHRQVYFIEKLLAKKTIEYKESDPVAFEAFCLTLKHQKGVWAGKPFVLSIEQRWIVHCILGIKIIDKDYKIWVRYFRECILGVARKWGKSLFCSALMIWFVAFDHEAGAECICFASNKNQARKVYEPVCEFIKRSPILKPNFRQQTFDGIPRMIVKGTNDFITYGSGIVKGKVGNNPHLAVFDEAHEITRTELYDAMTSGQGGRLQPLALIVSSGGIIRGSLYDAMLEIVEKLCKKSCVDDDTRIFFAIFEIDIEDDPDNPKCWIKANPGVKENRPPMSFLRKEHKISQLDITKRPTFLAMNLNRPTNSAVTYIELGELVNARIDIRQEYYFNTYAFAGDDLSQTTDLCCSTILIPTDDNCSEFVFLQRYFVAENRIEGNSERDKIIYKYFTNTVSKDPLCRELLCICKGSVVDKQDILNWYLELENKYKITIIKIGYDPWDKSNYLPLMLENFSKENVSRDENELIVRDSGVMSEVKQTAYYMSDAIKKVKILFSDEKLKYDRTNSLFEFCVNNLKVSPDRNNNIMIDKSKSTGRVDGFASLVDSYIAMTRGIETYLAITKNSNPYQGGLKTIERTKKTNKSALV